MDNIAFIGSSPSISFYVDTLSKYSKCTIFEKSEFGGAWAESSIENLITPRACNGIGQKNYSDDIFFQFEDYLITRGAAMKRLNGELPGHTSNPYSFHLVGQIMPAITSIYKKDNIYIINEQVKLIEIFENCAYVNGRKYDGVILPEHFLLNRLKILSHNLDVEINTIKSKHIRFKLFTEIDSSYYKIETDNIFDRGGLQFPSNKIFIGRVRKESKNIPLNSLVQQSEWAVLNFDNIQKFELLEYNSHWISANTLDKIRTGLIGTSSRLVQTQDIVEAFINSKTLVNQLFYNINDV